jgi:hypothetical protein
MTFKQLTALVAAIWSMVGCASAQNFIADPTFANSTTVNTVSTTYTQDGNWDFLELSPGGSKITFPGNMPFNPKNNGDIYAAPLNSGGTQITLTSGKTYDYSVKVYGGGTDNIYLYVGSTQEESFAGGGAGGATYTGSFVPGVTGVLSFVIPSADGKVGLTNVDVQLPEPRSVFFCALLAVGICGVERSRLRKILMRARSKLKLVEKCMSGK